MLSKYTPRISNICGEAVTDEWKKDPNNRLKLADINNAMCKMHLQETYKSVARAGSFAGGAVIGSIVSQNSLAVTFAVATGCLAIKTGSIIKNGYIAYSHHTQARANRK